MSRQAILLVNLGSPASTATADVRTYLDEFLMDPLVLDIPTPLRALLVKGLILNTRPAKSAEAYAKVWTPDGSPLIVISERTRAALETHAGVPVGLGMRYGEPSIPHAIDALLARAGAIDEVIVVPMYPHYAMASTKTVEVAVDAAMHGRGVRHHFTPPFFADAGYLDALAARIRADRPAEPHYLLFSYHGIPKRHVRKMDPTGDHCLQSADCCTTPSVAHATCYRHQVITTTERVAERLGLAKTEYGLAFQSRLGGGWLEPFTDKELALLPGRGVKHLAVVCPAFVADCLETLEEIEMRGRETFMEAGGTSFSYIRCVNDDPAWIAALAAIALAPLATPA
jgi:ferrochelatase